MVPQLLVARACGDALFLRALLLSLLAREAAFARNLSFLGELESWEGGATATVEDILDALDAGRPEPPC